MVSNSIVRRTRRSKNHGIINTTIASITHQRSVRIGSCTRHGQGLPLTCHGQGLWLTWVGAGVRKREGERARERGRREGARREPVDAWPRRGYARTKASSTALAVKERRRVTASSTVFTVKNRSEWGERSKTDEHRTSRVNRSGLNEKELKRVVF